MRHKKTFHNALAGDIVIYWTGVRRQCLCRGDRGATAATPAGDGTPTSSDTASRGGTYRNGDGRGDAGVADGVHWPLPAAAGGLSANKPSIYDGVPS